MKLCYDTGAAGNLLTDEKAEQIGLTFSEDSEELYLYQYGGGFTYDRSADNHYYDPIFGVFFRATPTDSLARYLRLPVTEVDGRVGFTHLQHEKCLELDFQTQRLSFIDTLPQFYMDDPLVQKIPMVMTDTLYETRYSSYMARQSLSIPGIFRLVDSIELRTNFVLDLGTPTYTMISAFDEPLFHKMIAHKAAMVERYGKDHPTVGLKIPELSIDTMMTNIRTYPIFKENDLYRIGFGTAKIGGLLGIEFFMRYDKILFDWKHRTAYFYKE
jgi:hypothetical protein